MKITFIGPAYPYRGGLATIIETLARVFQAKGNEVSIKTFSLQYTRLIFPGKSLFRWGGAPRDLHITREVSTINPLSWLKVGRRLRKEKPDVVVLKYWTPLMAPCFGTICRIARRNGHTKVVVHLDNITPHEPHFYDRILNRYGDTPEGMVESALEFARVARELDYHQLVFSMKSSNVKVMIQAYRLLVKRLAE